MLLTLSYSQMKMNATSTTVIAHTSVSTLKDPFNADALKTMALTPILELAFQVYTLITFPVLYCSGLAYSMIMR